jgi:hypothetical protein
MLISAGVGCAWPKTAMPLATRSKIMFAAKLVVGFIYFLFLDGCEKAVSSE